MLCIAQYFSYQYPGAQTVGPGHQHTTGFNVHCTTTMKHNEIILKVFFYLIEHCSAGY